MSKVKQFTIGFLLAIITGSATFWITSPKGHNKSPLTEETCDTWRNNCWRHSA